MKTQHILAVFRAHRLPVHSLKMLWKDLSATPCHQDSRRSSHTCSVLSSVIIVLFNKKSGKEERWLFIRHSLQAACATFPSKEKHTLHRQKPFPPRERGTACGGWSVSIYPSSFVIEPKRCLLGISPIVLFSTNYDHIPNTIQQSISRQ